MIGFVGESDIGSPELSGNKDNKTCLCCCFSCCCCCCVYAYVRTRREAEFVI